MPLPYVGNPANFPTAIQIPSGSDAPSSTLFGTAYEGLADRTAATQNHGTLSDLVSLQPTFVISGLSPTTPSGPYAACFDDSSMAVDPTNGQSWLFAMWDASTNHARVYAGACDQPIGTVTPLPQIGGDISYTKNPTSICTDTAGAIYVAGFGGLSSTEADIFRMPVAGSFASYLTISGVTNPSDIQIATIGTSIFYAVGSTTASNAQISGGSGGGFTALTCAKWIVRSNGSMVLFVPAVAAPSGIVYKATGTATFTSAPLATGVNDVPLDLTWNPQINGGTWVLVVLTAGGATTIWTSPDGVTWTLTKTLSHLANPIRSIASVGPHVIGVMVNNANNGPDQLCSSSDGGATWVFYQSGTTGGVGSGGFVSHRVLAAPNQIMCAPLVNNLTVFTSQFRLSRIYGVGDQVLT